MGTAKKQDWWVSEGKFAAKRNQKKSEAPLMKAVSGYELLSTWTWTLSVVLPETDTVLSIYRTETIWPPGFGDEGLFTRVNAGPVWRCPGAVSGTDRVIRIQNGNQPIAGV